MTRNEFLDLSERDFERSLIDSARADSSPKNVELVWASFASALTGAAKHLEVSGLHRLELEQKVENLQESEMARVAHSSFARAPVWLLAGALGGSALTAALLLSPGHTIASPPHRQFLPPAAPVPTSVQPLHPMALESNPANAGASALGPGLSVANRHVLGQDGVMVRDRVAGPALHSVRRQSSIPVGSVEAQARVGASERVESTLAAEVDQLDAARTAYRAGAYQEAISLVDSYHRRFPRGVLAPDAEVVAILSLGEQKNRSGAVERAARFLEMYPKDPHAGLVRHLALP